MQNETWGCLISVREMLKSRLGLKICEGLPHEISNVEVMAPAAHEHHWFIIVNTYEIFANL